MKTLIAYYSKTGNTRVVAERLAEKLSCDVDEIIYNEAAKTIKSSLSPADYEHVVLLSPIWAFSLAEPMKIYVKENGKKFAQYSIIVTCSGAGLRGAVGYCVRNIGKRPLSSKKFRAKAVKSNTFELGD